MAMRYLQCPSCRYRLSPLTTECPQCGIPITRGALNKPLLFQISKGMPMQQQEEDNTARTNIPAPKTAAASATAPIAKGAGNKPLPAPMPSKGIPPSAKKHSKAEGQGIFWRLARMEFMEAIFLLLINTLIVFIAGWQLNMSPGQMFEASWTFLAPLHLLVSWAYFMLPIVLTGSSVAMLLLDFGIADAQPEKRLFFSFFMLLSVVLLPLSFVCMILTPAHATLAELLTGQEVRERSLA